MGILCCNYQFTNTLLVMLTSITFKCEHIVVQIWQLTVINLYKFALGTAGKYKALYPGSLYPRYLMKYCMLPRYEEIFINTIWHNPCCRVRYVLIKTKYFKVIPQILEIILNVSLHNFKEKWLKKLKKGNERKERWVLIRDRKTFTNVFFAFFLR